MQEIMTSDCFMKVLLQVCPSLVGVSCFYWLQPDRQLLQEIKNILVKKKIQSADEDILNPLGKLGKGLIAAFTYNLHTETYIL